MNGYSDTLPKIKELGFTELSIQLFLSDGRIIVVPLTKFPSIKKLTPAQRKKYHIMAGVGFDFDASDEVYHISEFLGADNSIPSLERRLNAYHTTSSLSRVAEPLAKYRKKK